jgi:hypothetical protein
VSTSLASALVIFRSPARLPQPIAKRSNTGRLISSSAPLLDAYPPLTENASVRVRLLLIATILTVLAFAGFSRGDQQSTEPRDNAPTSGQLADQPAPDAALPVIMGAAVTASAPVQTLPHFGWCRHLPPTRGAFTASPPVPVVPHGATVARSFPLLI